MKNLQTMQHVVLEENEQILAILREHKFLLSVKILFWFVIWLIPYGIRLGLEYFGFSFPDAATENIWLLLEDLYRLLALMGLLMIVAFYYLNVHIVTTDRLIDRDQLAIYRHRSVELDIKRIQNVSTHISGFWGHLFNYGHVNVESAGENPNITFENVADPQKVKRIILDYYYSTAPDASE